MERIKPKFPEAATWQVEELMEKGETMMKRRIGKISSLIAAVMLVTSLVGCAGSQMEAQTQLAKVKCPACGYEFHVAEGDGG
jgi:hypothetical protein